MDNTQKYLEQLIREAMWDALTDYLPGSDSSKMRKALQQISGEMPDELDAGEKGKALPPPIPADAAEEDEKRALLNTLALNLRKDRAKLGLAIKREIENYFNKASLPIKKDAKSRKMFDDIEKAVIRNTVKSLIRNMNAITSAKNIKEECGDFGPKKKIK